MHKAGFDASEPTAWAAEGLLPYLPADGQDVLFERIHQFSAHGSRVGVESFGAGFFDTGYLAARRESVRVMRDAAGGGDDDNVPDTEELWYIEERTDVADWLTEHGWDVTSFGAAELITRYGRCSPGQVDDATPRSVFVEGRLTG